MDKTFGAFGYTLTRSPANGPAVIIGASPSRPEGLSVLRSPLLTSDFEVDEFVNRIRIDLDIASEAAKLGKRPAIPS